VSAFRVKSPPEAARWLSRRSALCTEQGATALRRAISSLPYFPYTDLTAPSGNAAVAYSEARRDLVAAQGVPFSQHFFAIDDDVRSKNASVRFR